MCAVITSRAVCWWEGKGGSPSRLRDKRFDALVNGVADRAEGGKSLLLSPDAYQTSHEWLLVEDHSIAPCSPHRYDGENPGTQNRSLDNA
jgi:hypothetical protein